jgi:Fe-S-cluster-containing hydrogenase component 2
LPYVDESLCTQCGLCVEACPCGGVAMGDTGPVFACPDVCSLAEDETCDEWCLCEELCPNAAIVCAFEIVLEAEPTPPQRFLDAHTTNKGGEVQE